MRHAVHLDQAILEREWPGADQFEIDLGVPTLGVDRTDGYLPDLDSIVRFASTGPSTDG